MSNHERAAFDTCSFQYCAPQTPAESARDETAGFPRDNNVEVHGSDSDEKSSSRNVHGLINIHPFMRTYHAQFVLAGTLSDRMPDD